MRNDKFVEIDGVKMPISNVRHWQFHPQNIVPMRSEEETLKWMALETLKQGWDELNPDMIFGLLSDDFIYGSYWVRDKLDLGGYKNYLPLKFKSIGNADTRPSVDVVVLYEGIAPQNFPYALRLIQGSVTCLLTVNFSGTRISSLYMTDPDIFTYEPTFRKGGVLSESGEPMCFCHECAKSDVGRRMSEPELQAFVVESVVKLFNQANASVEGVFKSAYKEFPNIITRCGGDLFYHRIDVTDHGVAINMEQKEYEASARKHGALPLVMPVSVLCSETDGGEPVCGGSFFLKVLESRIISA